MIGIRYQDHFLDVDPGAGLTWDLMNLVFSSSDASRLPGSFSFPFSLPATPRNRSLLKYPDRIDSADPFLIEGSVTIQYSGIPLFVGTMKVTEASIAGIKVYIVANPLSAIKSTPLNQLDLGGDRTFADAAAVLSHANDTAANPLDYDYVFFPIWNRAFVGDPSADPRGRFQNWYNSTTGAFQVADDYPALMPFVRLEYLLERIFDGQEYTFENRFQIGEELRKICLYNNFSMWSSAGLATTINLKNHVSKTGSAAIVRKIMSGFCLGLFYNPWDKVLRLIPLRDIISAPPKHDWTDRVIHAPVVLTSDQQPEVICWKRDDSDGAWEHYDKYPKPATVTGTLSWADVLTAGAGTYYVPDRHSYYQKIVSPTRYFFKHTTLGCAPLDDGDPKFEAECMALFDAFLYGEGQTAIADGNYDLIPHCRIPGTVEYDRIPAGGDTPESVQQQAEVPDRITIYRGMYNDFDGDPYPLASGIPWDGAGNLIGDYSLRWDGQYGMYETWWKGWHTMLRQGKNVTATLLLTLTDILNFNFEDKVRIQNQDFFVKKMRISLTPRGIAPVEVELVSVI